MAMKLQEQNDFLGLKIQMLQREKKMMKISTDSRSKFFIIVDEQAETEKAKSMAAEAKYPSYLRKMSRLAVKPLGRRPQLDSDDEREDPNEDPKSGLNPFQTAISAAPSPNFRYFDLSQI
jgi:hypothetical protein